MTLVEEGGTVEAQRSGGRRWVPVYWLSSTPVDGTSYDRLDHLSMGGAGSDLADRSYEYRLVWDVDRSMWRLDRRRFVPGG